MHIAIRLIKHASWQEVVMATMVDREWWLNLSHQFLMGEKDFIRDSGPLPILASWFHDTNLVITIYNFSDFTWITLTPIHHKTPVSNSNVIRLMVIFRGSDV